jgi:hypothetical protein
VIAAESRSEPRQPSRFEKKKNISRRTFVSQCSHTPENTIYLAAAQP